jgi:hypothetical protein
MSGKIQRIAVSVAGGVHPRRPLIEILVKVKEQIGQDFRDNRRKKSDETACKMNISQR